MRSTLEDVMVQAAALGIVVGVGAILVWAIRRSQRRDRMQEYETSTDRVSARWLEAKRREGLI